MTKCTKTWLCSALLLALIPLAGFAAVAPVPAPVVRDGAHDFDFGIGVFKTHIRRLVKPLTGSSTWEEWNGTVSTRKLWGGKGQLEEIEIDGPAGAHLQGITPRLYDPAAHQWRLYWTSSDDGQLGQPVIGEFKDGRGEFYGQDDSGGRTVLVRNAYFDASDHGYSFEQAFSADGGKTWEPNFVAKLTRVAADVAPEAEASGLSADQHAFDWQFGSWDMHMSRRKDPLTGSKDWYPLQARVVVDRIWGGRANLAEIDATGPGGKLQFLALRLYNPAAKQWSLNFAGSSGGSFGVPMIGEFKDGRGEFYSQDTDKGRTILARFVFSDGTAPGSHHEEQSYSADGGKTWEVNWINDATPAHD